MTKKRISLFGKKKDGKEGLGIAATVALAAVKGKKLSNKNKNNKKDKEKDKKRNNIKQSSSSSSEYFSGSSSESQSSSGEESSQSDGSDSYRSQSKPLKNVSSKGAVQSNTYDSGSDSSSTYGYGCGTYHRRESLSQASESSSAVSDESSSVVSDESYSSSSRSNSSDGSHSSRSRSDSSGRSESRSLSGSSISRVSEESHPSSNHEVENFNNSSGALSFGSRPKLKSLVKAISSKKIPKKELDVDVDDQSDASSYVSRKSKQSEASSRVSRKSKPSEAPSNVSRKSKPSVVPSNTSQKSNPNLNPSMYDNEQANMMQRRQSNRGAGRGKGRRVSKAQDSKVEAGDSGDNVDDKFSDLLGKVRSQKMKGDNNNGNSKVRSKASLQKQQRENASPKNEPSRSGPAKKQAKPSQNGHTNLPAAGQTNNAIGSRDAGAELSYSLKKELLANANSNLRSSATSPGEESTNSQNGGSSRFASMMANLKSSNDKTNTLATKNDDPGSDDDMIFEAPKIVNEKGQSASALTEESRAGNVEEDDDDEGPRSRFRVSRPSVGELTDKSSEGQSEVMDTAVDNIQGSEEDSGEYYSDSRSHHSDASISTASSVEDETDEPVTDFARMRYPEDEENLSEDDLEYYGEAAMTILTPITEMGSMESDEVETTSHVSDETETASDDDVMEELNFVDKKVDPDKSIETPTTKSDVISSNLLEAVGRTRDNDYDFKEINFDDCGLDDSAVGTLLSALDGNTVITHLSFSNNKLGDRSARVLAQIFSCSHSIVSVKLRGNIIGNEGAIALKKALVGNNSLEHLDLNDNDIDPYVMASLQRNSTAIASSDSSSPSTEDLDGAFEKITACRGSGIDPLETLLSIKESGSKTKDEASFQLAMSLALSCLDSRWLLKTPSGRGAGSFQPGIVGERGSLTPNMRLMKNGIRCTAEDGSTKRKASSSLQNMTKETWNDVISKPSSLRPSILSLSEQWIDDEAIDITSSSVHPGALPLTDEKQGPPSNEKQWVSSFKKLDPRWQIRKFFNDMSVFGTVLSDVTQSDAMSEGTAIFTVWRPTSADAIAKMMKGDGVGKGLEIKGKSAKKGALSGFIPFMQIHQEEHKKQIRTIPKKDRTKIFFKGPEARDRVGEYLGKVAKEMTLRVARAKFALAKAKFGCDPNTILREELSYAAQTLAFELEDPKVVQNDDYAPDYYCIEVSCRVLWEGLVQRKDITREPGSDMDTGRASQPAFQDMNFAAVRRRVPDEPLPVIYQCSDDDPFDARMLVMAYEEEGKVVPVVSDFDCFLIGSRNFSYEDPMSEEQVDLLDWCVSQIEWILDSHTEPESWTTRWLEVLKYAARNGFYPSMPRFGFGDPTSYSMIEASVHRSAKTCGAVRHGPECFNFFFPQELDEEFLIIFPGGQIWKYVNERELRGILRQKIREGFTFPLNPKWLLCDPGWITLFQDLLQSNNPSVRDSLDLWFPPESGLRERILDISHRFPSGFLRDDQIEQKSWILAEQEYERYLILQRALRKVRGFIYWRSLLLDIQKRASSNVDENCRGAAKEFQFLQQESGTPDMAISEKKTRDMEKDTIKKIRKLDFYGKGNGSSEVNLLN